MVSNIMRVSMRAATNMIKKDPCTLPVVTSLEDQDFRLPAVDRAISLFELLANSQQGLTLSELSRKLNIPKSTTHYLIHTLVTRGYVQRGSDGRHYLLGLRLADVASANPVELNLRALAMPYLRQMAARFNLTATATVQRGAEAVIIAKVESFQDAGGGAWIGRHLDLHCTAQGKALISSLSEEKLDNLFGGRDLARFTPKTIASLTALKAHLALVRANGFSVNDEEQVAGIRAVAVPVTDSIGAVVAAFSVRGSTGQIPIPRFPILGREMLFLSREFSHNQ
jgi:DNA-binding IclR family transcriptional regulator